MLAIPVPDTLKRVDAQQQIQETVSRQGLWLAQTPQVFRRDWLTDVYARRGQSPHLTVSPESGGQGRVRAILHVRQRRWSTRDATLLRTVELWFANANAREQFHR